jgi:hydroxymethylpyrimidine/phosphomethylpyrimidine kinase
VHFSLVLYFLLFESQKSLNFPPDQVFDTFAIMVASPPIVLTVAGFDPSSGAGITADIKTAAALGCYAVATITAMTVQSTTGVRQVMPVSPQFLTDSLDELMRDVKVSAVHLGMLGCGEVALRVSRFLQEYRPPNIVLDPVLKSSSGASLFEEAGIEVLIQTLLPLADVITPNLDEAAALTGLEARNTEQMRQAAERLHQLGAKAVVVTGGHLERALDLLSIKGKGVQTFEAEKINSDNTHGTGCAFSTAIACHLARGRDLPDAVESAKAYVREAIRSSYSIGSGAGPINHASGGMNRAG